MKKNIKRSFAFLALFSLLGVIRVFAEFSDAVSVTSRISTGDVNIQLKELEVSDGKEVSYSNEKLVMPGDVVSKIPRIINLAEPCWIRAKVSFTNSQEAMEGFSQKNLLGMPEGWKKIGSYYYYTKVLERSHEVNLFTKVQIPKEWENAHEGQKLSMIIRADAIQAANFQPDFHSSSPWGSQEIELCVHETDGKALTDKNTRKLSVEFNGEAHKLLAVPDDFFSNFQVAMPGDQFQDSIEISNTTKKDAEIFFRTAVVNQSEEQIDLLKKLRLNIYINGRKLYSCSLKADSLNEEVSLGTYRPGEKGQMDFTITVPETLKNAYALRDAEVTWIFTVKELEEDPSTDDEPGGEGTISPAPADRSTEGNNGTSSPVSTAQKVKTGDESPILFLLILTVITIAAMVMSVRKGGKNR